VTFEEGIAKTFEWYRANQDWVKDLEEKIVVPEFKESSKAPLKSSR